MRGFLVDCIDGVFMIAGPNTSLFRPRQLAAANGSGRRSSRSIPRWARCGRVATRVTSISAFSMVSPQPGIRVPLGVAAERGARSGASRPGSALAVEFILGYPGQDPHDPVKPGPIAPLPAPWARNGTYMVFRRLEQRVPEFRNFVAANARRLGISAELLAARMVGRWRSGAPLERAPLDDNPALADNDMQNNDFSYAHDPFQRACPYAAHVRKTNPR